MKDRKRRNAERSRRNRARAKAETAKNRALYAFLLSEGIELLVRFETEWQARVSTEAVPEATIIEEILDFDTSLLE